MIDLIACVSSAFIGAAIALLCQRTSLNRYFELVECLWSQDMERLNKRIDKLSNTQ